MAYDNSGIIITGLGFAWDKKDAGGLVIAFSLLGIFVALSAFTVLPFFSLSVRELMRWWDAYKPSDYNGPDIVGFRSSRSNGWWLLRPWRALPFIFVIGWLIIFFVHLTRIK